jgi:hypothetical protein
VLLSTLLHAILHPSHHLLDVLLQIANKLGLSKKINFAIPVLIFIFSLFPGKQDSQIRYGLMKEFYLILELVPNI